MDKPEVIKVGPIMKKVLEKQRKILQDATYGCVAGSYLEIAEIIAKKAQANDPALR